MPCDRLVEFINPRHLLTAAAISGAVMLGGLAPERARAAEATPGVTPTEIRIGNTMPYSGPASALGNTGKVLAAYFQMVNDQGGVNGRKVALISRDDAFSPPKTVEQTRKLVEDDQVAVMFATMGTAPSSAIQKYLNAKKVPQLFVVSSASRFVDPKNSPMTLPLPWQPPYAAEVGIFLDHARKLKPDAKVAILYQNDDTGKEYVNAARALLGADADKVIAAALPYEVTDPTVDSQVLNLAATKADALLIMGVTPRACSQAIRKAWEIGWRPQRYLASGCANPDQILKPAGLEKADGLITITSFKPTSPEMQSDKGVADYLAFMKKYAPGLDPSDFFALYGYISAGAMHHVLKAAGDDLSRENIMKTATNMKDVALPMLLDGIKLNTTPDDYQVLNTAYLAKFENGRWTPFGELVSGRK